MDFGEGNGERLDFQSGQTELSGQTQSPLPVYISMTKISFPLLLPVPTGIRERPILPMSAA